MESSLAPTPPKTNVESSFAPNSMSSTPVESSLAPNIASSTTSIESSSNTPTSSTLSIESSSNTPTSSTLSIESSSSTPLEQSSPLPENSSEIHASDEAKSINDDILFFDLESKDVSESPKNVSMCLSTDTCEGRCHGGSSLTCWCDRRCVENGDCCCDYKVWCEDDESSDDASSLEKGFENQDDKSPDSDFIDDSQDPEDA